MSIGRAPKTIGRGKYRVDRVLGEGAMGTVYAVTQLRVNRAYALKKLRADLRSRDDIYRRFLREGWLANAVAVEHPGAVQVFEDGLDDDDLPFLVMELLDGAVVDEVLDNFGGKLGLRESLGIVHQLLDVLHAAHHKGVVHRDIKPANLFICRDGRLKVLDFGISKLHRAATNPDGEPSHSLVGTPAFMSPEQARAEGGDPCSDIFSVGATLFALVSGESLHPGSAAGEVIRRASSEPARSLTRVAPDAPLAVVELVAKAVAFEPAQRFQSAAEMRDAVASVHESLFGPVQAVHLAELVRERAASTTKSAPSIGTSPTEPWLGAAEIPAPPSRKVSWSRGRPQGSEPRFQFPTLVSPVELPLAGGAVGLSTVSVLDAAPRRLGPILAAVAFPAVLLAIAFGILGERERSAHRLRTPAPLPVTSVRLTVPVVLTSARSEPQRAESRADSGDLPAPPLASAALKSLRRRGSLPAPVPSLTAPAVQASPSVPPPTPFLAPALPLPERR